MDNSKEPRELGLAATDLIVAAISGVTPIAGIVGKEIHFADALEKYIGYFRLRKIDKFISL